MGHHFETLASRMLTAVNYLPRTLSLFHSLKWAPYLICKSILIICLRLSLSLRKAEAKLCSLELFEYKNCKFIYSHAYDLIAKGGKNMLKYIYSLLFFVVKFETFLNFWEGLTWAYRHYICFCRRNDLEKLYYL